MTAVLLLAWLTVQSAGADPMSHIQAGLEARKAPRRHRNRGVSQSDRVGS
jgi:hypothetical protein